MTGVGKTGSKLVPQWTDQQIDDVFTKQRSEYLAKVIEVLSYLGEEFVNKARRQGTYRDRTGNLRSSVGYVIIVNGSVTRKHIAATGEAMADTEQLIEEVRRLWAGTVLVGFAGMNYAAAVEAKHYDVITGSVPTTERVKQIMEKLIKGLKK